MAPVQKARGQGRLQQQVGSSGTSMSVSYRCLFSCLQFSCLHSPAFHSYVSLPSPITGKVEMRNRAAPIGISVTVSVGWSDFTGLGCNLPTRPSASCFHAGIRFAVDRKST